MFYVKVYGESCNYYLSSPQGSFTLKLSETHRFETENEARSVGQRLFQKKQISRWEIKEFRREPVS